MTNFRNGSGVSRRGVLKGATALGAAALILPAGMKPASAEPKKGGILRIGMGHGNTGDNYDPGTWDHAYSQVFSQCRHNYLTEIAADGSLVPEVGSAKVLLNTWPNKGPDAICWRLTWTKRRELPSRSGKGEALPRPMLWMSDSRIR